MYEIVGGLVIKVRGYREFEVFVYRGKCVEICVGFVVVIFIIGIDYKMSFFFVKECRIVFEVI